MEALGKKVVARFFDDFRFGRIAWKRESCNIGILLERLDVLLSVRTRCLKLVPGLSLFYVTFLDVSMVQPFPKHRKRAKTVTLKGPSPIFRFLSVSG
ncbi:hypothetical protein L596_029596 [Steinernema carpocapsae]|uniref:Uncharacterized protein n=1 Tax=Steinernema carpocapsae TaxID=34508 RepID=A0A4U5LV39_STECR|nr:hypothetical protein L596_029596 [Steinernema carpocapsae]